MRTSPSPARSDGADEGQHAMPAPGRLEQVIDGVERLGARRRPHRGDVARARERRLEPEVQLLGHRAPMVPVGRQPGGDRLHRKTSDPGPATRGRRSIRALASSEEPVPRPARPDDLFRLAVPFDPRLSPDGRHVAFSVKRTSVGHDGYRHSVWMAPTDGSAPARQVTIGGRTDRYPRFSPDGRTLAFISDRRLLVEEEPDRPKEAKDRLDCDQVFLLPLDGGEARRLTDLPRGVDEFAWSPDGRWLAVVSSSLGATIAEESKKRGRPAAPKPGEPPLSDYRYIDRLGYQFNGAGFVDDRDAHLWLVDAETGEARSLVSGPTPEGEPAWSPDGTRIAFTANRRPHPDLDQRSSVFTVRRRERRRSRRSRAARDAAFSRPAWTPRRPHDRRRSATGSRACGYRCGIWLFAADGVGRGAGVAARTSWPASDLKPGSALSSDVTLGEGPHVVPAADGATLLFSAPVDGAYELWRIAARRDGELERLTDGRHYLSGWDAVAGAATGTSSPPSAPPRATLPEVWRSRPARRRAPRRRRDALTRSTPRSLDEIELVEPVERTGDGRRPRRSRAGSSRPAPARAAARARDPRRPAHALWLVADAGSSRSSPAPAIGVWPTATRAAPRATARRSTTPTSATGATGPMRDVLAGVDAVVADGLADPDRLGVTGGSYGGYLTNWIVGHDRPLPGRDHLPLGRRHAACCSSPATSRAATGPGSSSARRRGRTRPYFREISPLSLRRRRSGRRCSSSTPSGTCARRSPRPRRCSRSCARSAGRSGCMRVPEETHELTRSRDAVPAGREPASRSRDWFRALPRRRQARPAAAAPGPREPLAAGLRLVARGPGVSSPSHDRHATPDTADPRARPAS